METEMSIRKTILPQLAGIKCSTSGLGVPVGSMSPGIVILRCSGKQQALATTTSCSTPPPQQSCPNLSLYNHNLNLNLHNQQSQETTQALEATEWDGYTQDHQLPKIAILTQDEKPVFGLMCFS